MATRSDETSLTPQQRRALELRDVAIALSAGAGCGKTFVLTERFLSHLTPGKSARLDELIAITFTERAAREMRDRIRRAITTRLQSADERHAAHWLALLRSLQQARISTIHAFCATLLRSHAIEAGIDPRFRVLDQDQAATFLTNTIDDSLREQLAARNEALLELAVQFDLRRVRAMIMRFLDARMRIDFPIWRQCAPDELLDRWGEHHHDFFLPRVLERFVADPLVAELLERLANMQSTNATMIERRRRLLELIPTLPASAVPVTDFEEIRQHAYKGVVRRTIGPIRRTTSESRICLSSCAKTHRQALATFDLGARAGSAPPRSPVCNCWKSSNRSRGSMPNAKGS